jgi:hypothetical protein
VIEPGPLVIKYGNGKSSIKGDFSGTFITSINGGFSVATFDYGG